MNPQSKGDNLNSLTVCVYIVSVGTKRERHISMNMNLSSCELEPDSTVVVHTLSHYECEQAFLEW